MNHHRIIAWLLLVTALLVILGMLIGIPLYWSIVDVAVVVICSGCGLYLLRHKRQVE